MEVAKVWRLTSVREECRNHVTVELAKHDKENRSQR